METPLKTVSWGSEIPVLSGNIEILFDLSREKNPRAYEQLDRFDLKDEPKASSFIPHLVNLENFSPTNIHERLERQGLCPLPLREYLSMRRHITENKIVLGHKLLVYVGEFIDSNTGKNTINVLGFFQGKDKTYEGILIHAEKRMFFRAGKNDRDYDYNRYAVVMPIS